MANTNQESKSTVNNLSNNSKPFDDMFDTIDETNDGLQFSTDVLNQYFLTGQLKSMIYEEEIIQYDILNDSDCVELIQEEEEEEEQQDNETILSQKLSQLSTKDQHEINSSDTSDKKRRLNIVTSPNLNSKKMKLSDNDNDEDNDFNDNHTIQNQIPNYLSMDNKTFLCIIKNIIKNIQSISMNDIQKLALLIHQVATFRLKREITTVYLQSVTGTLMEPNNDLIEVDRRVCPIQVQSLMLTDKKVKSKTTTETNQDDQQAACEDLLRERLEETNLEIDLAQSELIQKKNSLLEFTYDMDEALEIYVQEQGIKPLEMEHQLEKAIVMYNYQTEILERKYLHEQPNQYQMEVAKRLVNMRRDLEKSKRALLELKQAVIFNKSSISFDSIQISIPTQNDTTNNKGNVQQQQQQLLNQYEKQIRCKKFDLLARHILEAEQTYYRFQNLFNYELSKMWQNHRNLVKDQGMTTTLINLLEQRFNNTTNHWRDVYNYRIDYFLRNSYDKLNCINMNEIGQTMKMIGTSFSIFIDTTHQFLDKQLQLLSRGPSYVPPCLMYILFSNESMDDIVKKQLAPLKHQLMNLFEKYNINLPLQMEIHDKTYQEFKNLFSKPIPSNLYQRALYEKNLIQSIQSTLKKNNLILRRTANNMNTFYVGNIADFEKKADRYLTRSEDYEVLINITDETNEKTLDLSIKEMIDSMNSLLEKLKTHKAIKDDLYKQLIADPNKIKLPHLYFLPNISNENDISLVPIITSRFSATWKIGKYLNQLLQPFTDKILHSTTFVDEIDFIRKLNHYVNTEHRLRPTTLFCTIKITNFYTLDEHKNMIDVIGYFLQNNLLTNKLESLTIQTIRNLLYVFLYNNIFYYKDHIYKCTKGSPNTMALTETLSNIYLFVWQKKILKQIDRNIEFFGRYKDQIFFTWNKSSALELETFLENIREQHQNVRFQKVIGTNVECFNAYIQNRQGQLYTRLHYDSNMPRYTLPYVMGHSKSAHSDWLRTALIRAVCYCISIDEFQHERIALELTYLINGYSLLFVETHVKHFFNYFHAETVRYSRNQNGYDTFRQQWFQFVEQRYELIEQLEKFNNDGRLIQFNYIYDFGPRCRFNREFYKLWIHYFEKHPILSEENSKVILTTKHFHSLNTLLAVDKSSTIAGRQ
ncbi:unnamed protein product [Rotaria sordida]|uniref:Helix-turn-helix domain-containing protein n=1 Tax=Rotaria sordida TaxID=392033 RepID=A0A815XJI3_9BILA|nr:unnamed protein product [Rotaria sordida]CAF1558373.1 unnamed protein product [Rotaria sordida]